MRDRAPSGIAGFDEEGYDEVFGPTWHRNVPPKYTYAEWRRRGTWWQRMQRRLRRVWEQRLSRAA